MFEVYDAIKMMTVVKKIGVITYEKVMMEMTKGPLLTAKNAQADCIVTPCPCATSI